MNTSDTNASIEALIEKKFLAFELRMTSLIDEKIGSALKEKASVPSKDFVEALGRADRDDDETIEEFSAREEYESYHKKVKK